MLYPLFRRILSATGIYFYRTRDKSSNPDRTL